MYHIISEYNVNIFLTMDLGKLLTYHFIITKNEQIYIKFLEYRTCGRSNYATEKYQYLFKGIYEIYTKIYL